MTEREKAFAWMDSVLAELLRATGPTLDRGTGDDTLCDTTRGG